MKNYSSLRNPCSGEISERAPVDRAYSQSDEWNEGYRIGF